MKTIILSTTAAIALTAPSALGAITISQTATPGPTYPGHSLTFDDPGVPADIINPWTFYQASDGISFVSGNGTTAAGDWDAAFGVDGGEGMGNQLAGGFNLRMQFDAPIAELSWQGWADGSGPLSSINVILRLDGAVVASYEGAVPFGGTGDEWFNVTATDGDVFDEVQFYNSSSGSQFAFIDNVSFNSLPATACPGDIDGSGAVDFADVLDLIASWGGDGPGAEIAEPTDVVDFADLLGLLGAWGVCD